MRDIQQLAATVKTEEQHRQQQREYYATRCQLPQCVAAYQPAPSIAAVHELQARMLATRSIH